MANPMPDWSVEEILAVHFRMHKAEGVLFRDALVEAANACGLAVGNRRHQSDPVNVSAHEMAANAVAEAQ